jgi:protein-tyrosine phosphatase
MVDENFEQMSAVKFTDCHCHLLPGLDDGPAGSDEAVEMAAILASLGFSHIVCTPHFLKGAYDIHPARVRDAVTKLQEDLARAGMSLSVQASAEYYLDEFILGSLDDPLPLVGDVILVEAHCGVQHAFLADTAYQVITRKRLRPLIAHPERCDLFDCVLKEGRPGLRGLARALLNKFPPRNLHSDAWEVYRYPENALHMLRDMGCLFQGNIGSFAGLYGEQVRKRALCLLRMGLYDRLGTDAHRPGGLAFWLKEGMHVVMQEVGETGLNGLLRPSAALHP